MTTRWLTQVKWNRDGLVPVIAQEAGDGKVLMLAWMNREALQQTLTCGEAVYWSRSRNKLWHKGETSGNVQRVHDVRLDCDGDTILLQVTQNGNIACHTGRRTCFFQQLRDGCWTVTEPVLKDPTQMYGKAKP